MMADDDVLDLQRRNARLEQEVERLFKVLDAIMDSNARLRHEVHTLQTEQITMKGELK